MLRGDVFSWKGHKDAAGHVIKGPRLAVIVQADLPLSTVIIAPTSTGSHDADFRPIIEVDGRETRVLVEQIAAVPPESLTKYLCHVSFNEMEAINDALRVMLDLD